MRRTVFVSYSRRNLREVRALADDIRRLGHEVWLDTELSGGQRWWDNIIEAIGRCDAFVFALSTKSADSDACNRELAWARTLDRPILPVHVEGDLVSALVSANLGSLQTVDYRAANRASGLELARAFAALPAALPCPNPLPGPPDAPPTLFRARHPALHYVAAGGAALVLSVGFWLAHLLQDREDVRPIPNYLHAKDVAEPPPLPNDLNKEPWRNFHLVPDYVDPPKPPPDQWKPNLRKNTAPSAHGVRALFPPELDELEDSLAPAITRLKARTAAQQGPALELRGQARVASLGRSERLPGVKAWKAMATVDAVRADSGEILWRSTRTKSVSGETRAEALSRFLDSVSKGFVREVEGKIDGL